MNTKRSRRIFWIGPDRSPEEYLGWEGLDIGCFVDGCAERRALSSAGDSKYASFAEVATKHHAFPLQNP